ncbi:MAG TPA: HAD family hydrolase [Actinomycetota bacterium]|nr:HAD family hydrolase [Actinomycetota bacterium]
MSGYRAVLLDLYDTLAWTEWPALRGLIEERTGLSGRSLLDAFDLTREARSVGTYGSVEGDLRVVLEAAGFEPTTEVIGDLARLVGDVLGDGVHLWEDSLPVLRELRARGTRTVVVSNCDHSTRPVVERLGLPREADAVVLSFEAGVAKPDPGIYLAALEAVGARPEEALFVDDQARYCDGAVALGIDALLILREGDEPWEGVSEPGGYRVIGDLQALLGLV